MLLMMAEVIQWWRVAANLKDAGWTKIANLIAFHSEHVPWSGCSLHDLIQPSFSFLVGTSMAFSLHRRRSEQSQLASTAHALWRSILLIGLGIWLRSLHSARTNFTFEDTLTQIGLGYPFLFLIASTRGNRVAWASMAILLVGYWAVFARHPLPGPDFNWAAHGVPPQWAAAPADFIRDGFPGHWNMNSNFAADFDLWFLSSFPRTDAFAFNPGGYTTLNFIPTLGTMIMGLRGGITLLSPIPTKHKIAWLAAAGSIAISLAIVLDATGACPIIKRIWTPSWTLLSGGIAFLSLAAFHLVCDVMEIKTPFLPLIVLGSNSIAAYTIAHLWPDFIAKSLVRHLPSATFQSFGPQWSVPFLGACVLLSLWLFLAWMYRRKIFLKI